MLYGDYILKISNAVITQADNGLYFLEPAYKVILSNEGLWPDTVTDQVLNWSDVKEYLELEVAALNTAQSKTPAVIDWLHDVITATVDPAVLSEENDIIKTLIEYRNQQNMPKKRTRKKTGETA